MAETNVTNLPYKLSDDQIIQRGTVRLYCVIFNVFRTLIEVLRANSLSFLTLNLVLNDNGIVFSAYDEYSF